MSAPYAGSLQRKAKAELQEIALALSLSDRSPWISIATSGGSSIMSRTRFGSWRTKFSCGDVMMAVLGWVSGAEPGWGGLGSDVEIAFFA